jgi:hypothetical protein
LDIHMEEFYKNIGDTLKKNPKFWMPGWLQQTWLWNMLD